MPAEIYEIVALAARFWFLFLMALIVLRSYRWYARERRQRKKRLRLLPDAGYIGEFVVLQGAGDLKEGEVLSVPFEGTLGFVRSNDLCVPVPGVATRHLWFSYDERKGLKLTALGRNDFSVDEKTIGEQPKGLCMVHGSRLYIGECELRLRMFAGYEVGMNPQRMMTAGYPPQQWQQAPQAAYTGQGAAFPGMPYGGYASGQPYGMNQQPVYPQPSIYPQQPQPMMGYGQNVPFYPQNGYPQQSGWNGQPQAYQPQWGQMQPQTGYAPRAAMSPPAQPIPPQWQPEPSVQPVEEEVITFHPLMEDEDWEEEAYEEENRFASRDQERMERYTREPQQPVPQEFYPLETGEDVWPVMPRPDEWRSEGLFDDLLDEDGTDASLPPKSAYVGRDESAWAKRRIWDKYFGGGDAP